LALVYKRKESKILHRWCYWFNIQDFNLWS